MSTQENLVSEEDQQAQLNVIRQSLLNSAFQHFNQLIGFLKSLPIPQQIIGIQKGYSYFDDGMVWIKEVLNNCPIVLPQPKNNETELKIVEENNSENTCETPVG